MDRPRDVLEKDITGYFVHKKTLERFAVLQECKMIFGKNSEPAICYLRKGEMFIRGVADFHLNFERESS